MQRKNSMFSHMLNIKYAINGCLLFWTKDENLEDEITNPVLIIDDLDYAAMFVFHRGRRHGLFWLHWLCGFFLQLLLRNKMNKNTNSHAVFLIVLNKLSILHRTGRAENQDLNYLSAFLNLKKQQERQQRVRA